MSLILLGALLAPPCDAAGLPGLSDLISIAYLLLCPQRPEHSYVHFGYQLALEHHEIAMLGGLLLGSTLYHALRVHDAGRVPSWLMLVASVPMLRGVLTQMARLRESDWFTRTWTGDLFTLLYVFWLYPIVDQLLPLRAARARMCPLEVTP